MTRIHLRLTERECGNEMTERETCKTYWVKCGPKSEPEPAQWDGHCWTFIGSEGSPTPTMTVVYGVADAPPPPDSAFIETPEWPAQAAANAAHRAKRIAKLRRFIDETDDPIKKALLVAHMAEYDEHA